MSAHGYNKEDPDICKCGAQIVYWEDAMTYGCDVGGPIFARKWHYIDRYLRERPISDVSRRR